MLTGARRWSRRQKAGPRGNAILPTRAPASFKRMLGCTFNDLVDRQRWQNDDRRSLLPKPHQQLPPVHSDDRMRELSPRSERPLLGKDLHDPILSSIENCPRCHFHTFDEWSTIVIGDDLSPRRCMPIIPSSVDINAGPGRTDWEPGGNHLVQALRNRGGEPVRWWRIAYHRGLPCSLTDRA